MKRVAATVAFASAALFLAALPARADEASLQGKVAARLAKAKVARDGEVSVAVDRGAVVLDGAVATVDARRRAEDAARKEAKVVENRIRVVPEERKDADVLRDVRKAILTYPRLSIFDSVDLGVNDGVVSLAGSVYRPDHKSDIETRVGKVAGVREIKNVMTVQPASIFDDDLRRQLARQIYGNDVFARYAIQPNPSIRIVVDRGRVTLTGYVASPVERALLDSIARQTLAFAVVNDVKIDGEKPQDQKPATTGPEIEI